MVSAGGSHENVGVPEPDGGRPGWIAVLALWSINFVWVGVTKGLGMMLPIVQDQLNTQTWIIGWITAAVVATGGLVCKFTTLRAGYRAVLHFVQFCHLPFVWKEPMTKYTMHVDTDAESCHKHYLTMIENSNKYVPDTHSVIEINPGPRSTNRL